MHQAATSLTDRPQPDPSQDRPTANTPTPNADHLLLLIRWIITLGQTLADTIRQSAATVDLGPIARHFGTLDLAHILARVARALLVAHALEALLARRVSSGRDIVPTPVRLPSVKPQHPGGTIAKPAPQRTSIFDFPPEREPTAQEIAAELRHRAIGAVLADICHELNIMPGDLHRSRWLDLSRAIIFHAGNLTGLLRLSEHRFAVQRQPSGVVSLPANAAPASGEQPTTLAVARTAVLAGATGPPPEALANAAD
jgi:hypothetical protein